MNTYIAIFIGGGLGSLARYGVGKYVSKIIFGEIPFGTLFANVLSAFILGIFLGISSSKSYETSEAKYLIAIGFCGGFSTFSAFSAESFELLKNGMFFQCGINIAANVILCITMIALGSWIVK